MLLKSKSVAIILSCLVVGTKATWLAAQSAKPPSLKEQLEAQYDLAKFDAAKKVVSTAGTLLAVQKGGIFAVAPNLQTCPSTFEEGNLRSPSGACANSAKNSSRIFQVGEKVYLTEITVSPAKGAITLAVVNPQTFYVADVVFEFPKGYLEKANASDVEDTIGQVLTIESPDAEGQAPSQTVPAAPAPPTPQAASQALANDDIIKMTQVKLPDSIIINKIKSSMCSFDTSTDGLIKLKQAGVSDAVLQAIMGTAAPTAPAQAVAAAPPAPAAPPCNDYPSCMHGGETALQASQWATSLNYFQQASSLDPSKPDPWVELGKVYVGAGQYQDAETVWDKALALGGTVTLEVWHYKTTHYERGTFRMNGKTVSYVLPEGQTLFSTAPGELSSVKSHHAPFTASAWSFGMKVEKSRSWFSFVPVGVECRNPTLCRDPAGFAQEEAVGNYIAQTIARLASGGPTNSAPAAAQPGPTPAAALPSKKGSLAEQLEAVASVTDEILSNPSDTLPQSLLEKAICIGVVPSRSASVNLAADGQPRGALVCRRAGNGPWGPPSIFTLSGPSASPVHMDNVDFVLLVMNPQGADKMIQDKVKFGPQVSVAGGPVGARTSTLAATQASAEVLTYSRSGVFAGLSLNGAVFKHDQKDNEKLYNRGVSTRQILLDGGVNSPEAAQDLLNTLQKYSPKGGQAF